MDMPEIEDIRRITLNPDDVIVVRLKGRISADGARATKDRLRDAFPTQQIVVLDESATLDVVTPA